MMLCKGSESGVYGFLPVNMRNRPHASKLTHVVGFNINRNAKFHHYVDTIIAAEISSTGNYFMNLHQIADITQAILIRIFFPNWTALHSSIMYIKVTQFNFRFGGTVVERIFKRVKSLIRIFWEGSIFL